MAAMIVIFVALSLASGLLFSDAVEIITRSPDSDELTRDFDNYDKIPGLSDWCAKNNTRRPSKFWLNRRCCTEEYACNWYVDTNQTRDGLSNYSGYRRRTCDCDDKFYECATDRRASINRRLIRLSFYTHKCEKNNAWETGATWLQYWVNKK